MVSVAHSVSRSFNILKSSTHAEKVLEEACATALPLAWDRSPSGRSRLCPCRNPLPGSWPLLQALWAGGALCLAAALGFMLMRFVHGVTAAQLCVVTCECHG